MSNEVCPCPSCGSAMEDSQECQFCGYCEYKEEPKINFWNEHLHYVGETYWQHALVAGKFIKTARLIGGSSHPRFIAVCSPTIRNRCLFIIRVY